MNSSNPVAIVTGAARARGMGRAIALKLASSGVDVVVTDLPAHGTTAVGAELEETAELARQLGVTSLAVACDSTDSEDVARAVASAVSTFGRLDIVVNNAGTGVGSGPFADITDEQWNLSWNVNVMGAVRLTRAALPELAKNGGAVVNIASTLGLAGSAYYGAYVATKHAVVGLTRLLAAELGPQGIRVNAVAPGFIQTDMGAAELAAIAEAHGVSIDEATAGMVQGIPQRRLGTPEDVADAVHYLATGAPYTNGTVLTVHGGAVSGLN